MSISDLICERSHQPQAPRLHEQPSHDVLTQAFDHTIAVILAFDESTTALVVHGDDPSVEPVVCSNDNETIRPLQLYQEIPVLCHAIDLAVHSGFAGIFVLCSDEAVNECVSAAAKSYPDLTIKSIPFSEHDAHSEEALQCRFELIGITKSVLDAGAALAATAHCDQIMFLRADQPRLTPWHLLQLHTALAADPDAEVVTSWITWLRRMPLLTSRHFIESISERGLCASSPSSSIRPLPDLCVRDVVFGEERLEANCSAAKEISTFTREHTLSALQAVRLVRQMNVLTAQVAGKDVKETEDSTVASTAELARLKAQMEAMNAADVMLCALAQEVVEQQDAVLAQDDAFAADVRCVDASGRRERELFPIFAVREHVENLVYMDTAATAQRLGCALEAEHRFLAYENANIYRGAYALSADATSAYNDARAALEHFINADRRQTVITMNATHSLNLVAQAWGEHNIGEGDVILVATNEHHSNLLPWMMLAERKQAQIDYIGMNADGTLDLCHYVELLKLRPKLVCIAHISNVLGILNPVEHMAELAHAVGARVVIDAAQSLPHIPVDVKALGADFVAFSGHKLYGPFGVGGLWIHPDAFSEMDPLGGGGGTVSHASLDSYYLRQGAIQYEMGTPPISQAIGMAAACQHLEMIGMEAVALHDSVLTRYLMAGLRGLGFITVWGNHETDVGRHGLVAFSVLGADAAQVGRVCAEVGVAVRSGGHCALPLAASMGLAGTTRISFGIHTTQEDIDAALVAVHLCGKLFGLVV